MTKFKIGDIVRVKDEQKLSFIVEKLETNYGILGRTFYYLKDESGYDYCFFESDLELVNPVDPELVKLATELLHMDLFSVADAIECTCPGWFLERVGCDCEPTSTTPQDAEEKEVQDILKHFYGYSVSDVNEMLVRVLVSNGTLTLKQVERALRKG